MPNIPIAAAQLLCASAAWLVLGWEHAVLLQDAVAASPAPLWNPH